MNVEEQKPFLVTFKGSNFGYWLLVPPDDGSPLVKKSFKNLLESCDLLFLADTFNLRSIVDKAICVIQKHEKSQKIRVGSQCNRLMKHIQASAVYLVNYRDVATAIVSKIHLAMKWLFDVRPPREVGALELLTLIADIAVSVSGTADTRFYHIKKSADVVAEGLRIVLQKKKESGHSSQLLSPYIQSFLASAGISSDVKSPVVGIDELEDIRAVRIFSEMISKSVIFWEKIAEHFQMLKRLAEEIKALATATDMIPEQFDVLKQKVIQASAGWIAVKKVCCHYIKHISDTHLHRIAEKCLPVISDDFKDFAISVCAHFQDIECFLMTNDYDMQNEVAIYSTWVQPKINVSGSQCLETADEVSKLVSLGKVKEASRKLIEVKQQSKRLSTVTEIYIRRLEALEKYARYQQEKLMKKMEQLQIEEAQKRQDIQRLKEEMASRQRQVEHYEELKSKAEENRRVAEEKKRYAEKRRDEVKTWWWVPVYGQILCIREVIEDNASVIRNEERKVNEYEGEKSSLETKIQNTEAQISSKRNEVAYLSSKIRELNDESERRIKTLQEMMEATAMLKKTVYYWNEFMSATDHAATRSNAFQKIVKRASEKEDPSRVLNSGGSQTAMKNFEEAFATVERLLKEEWHHLILYDFVCELCHVQHSSLPMPVDNDTVVCHTCANKFIE